MIRNIRRIGKTIRNVTRFREILSVFVKHGFDDLANAVEIDATAKSLLARAPMNENGGGAGVFERARQIGRSDVLVIPAEPHLGRDRNSYSVDHSADESCGLIEFGHHGGTTANAADFLHRTSHVDVDGRNTQRLQRHRSITHFLGHRTEELHRQRAIGRAGFNELQGFGIFLEERTRIHEIRRGEVQAPNLTHGQSKRQVRVAGQRRQKQARFQVERTKTNHWREI